MSGLLVGGLLIILAFGCLLFVIVVVMGHRRDMESCADLARMAMVKARVARHDADIAVVKAHGVASLRTMLDMAMARLDVQGRTIREMERLLADQAELLGQLQAARLAERPGIDPPNETMSR